MQIVDFYEQNILLNERLKLRERELFYPTFQNDCCYYDSVVVIYRIWWSIFKQTM